MTCLFCDIAKGRADASIVYWDAEQIAFLDNRPIRQGHLQIIPRGHYDCFDDVPDRLAARMTLLGKRLARVHKRLYGVARVGFVFSGNDVAHAHAHLIPLHAKDDVTSARYGEDIGLIDAAARSRVAGELIRAL